MAEEASRVGSKEYKVWANTKDLKLVHGDIEKALAAVENVRIVILNPLNQNLASEVPSGIRVEYRVGVLKWEVWMEGKDIVAKGVVGTLGREVAFVPPSPAESKQVVAREKEIRSVVAQSKRPRGRPRKEVLKT